MKLFYTQKQQHLAQKTKKIGCFYSSSVFLPFVFAIININFSIIMKADSVREAN